MNGHLIGGGASVLHPVGIRDQSVPCWNVGLGLPRIPPLAGRKGTGVVSMPNVCSMLGQDKLTAVPYKWRGRDQGQGQDQDLAPAVPHRSSFCF